MSRVSKPLFTPSERRARGNKPLHSVPSHPIYTISQWNGKWDNISRSERERDSRPAAQGGCGWIRPRLGSLNPKNLNSKGQ